LLHFPMKDRTVTSSQHGTDQRLLCMTVGSCHVVFHDIPTGTFSAIAREWNAAFLG